MKRHLMVVLLPFVITLSSFVGAHAREYKEAVQSRRGLRGHSGEDMLPPSASRYLKDEEDEGNDEAANDDANAEGQAVNDDAVKYYQYNDDGYNAWVNGEYDGEEWYEVEATDDDGNSNSNSAWYGKNTTGMIKSTVQSYANDASSTAWQFYDTPPHEWTASQWNLVFGLVLSFFTLCCIGAACCAYQCLNAADDLTVEEGYPLSPKKGTWSPRRPEDSPRSPDTPEMPTSPVARVFAAARHYRGRRKNQRNRKKNRREYDEDHYRRYQEEVEDGGILDDDDHIVQLAKLDDDTEAASVNTDAERSYYEAPRMTTSLAEYTSVQREKEARILEALQEEDLRKSEEMRKQKAALEKNANETNPTEYDDENDWSDETPTAAQTKTDRNVGRIYTNDDWKDDAYDNNGIKNKNQPTMRPKMKSTQELNMALRSMKEDKLLEARERKHNFVGYYL